MKTRNAIIGALATAVASTAYGLWLAPQLPAKVPSHWDLHGKVDGWSDKATAVWFGPMLMLGALLMMVLLPWLSPKSFTVESFRKTFNLILFFVVAWMGWMNALTLYAGLHPGMEVGRWIIASVLVLIALIGNQLGKVGKNFWLGIRTPWTLASDRVWIATHRLSAWLFMGVGLLGGLAVMLGFPPIAAFVLVMIAVVIPVLYSLVLYKQLESRQAL